MKCNGSGHSQSLFHSPSPLIFPSAFLYHHFSVPPPFRTRPHTVPGNIPRSFLTSFVLIHSGQNSKFLSEELHTLYSSPNIWMIKSRMKCARHIILKQIFKNMMGFTSSNSFFVLLCTLILELLICFDQMSIQFTESLRITLTLPLEAHAMIVSRTGH